MEHNEVAMNLIPVINQVIEDHSGCMKFEKSKEKEGMYILHWLLEDELGPEEKLVCSENWEEEYEALVDVLTDVVSDRIRDNIKAYIYAVTSWEAPTLNV